MEEIKLQCMIEAEDEMILDYGNKLFCISMFKHEENTSALIFNREDAEKLVKFIQRMLDKEE